MKFLREWWLRFKTAHFFRARSRSYCVSPCSESWWAYGVINADDLDRIADFAWLRLPSYQWKENFRTREFCWHQWVIVFHGREGFSLQLWACPE